MPISVFQRAYPDLAKGHCVLTYHWIPRHIPFGRPMQTVNPKSLGPKPLADVTVDEGDCRGIIGKSQKNQKVSGWWILQPDLCGFFIPVQFSQGQRISWTKHLIAYIIPQVVIPQFHNYPTVPVYSYNYGNYSPKSCVSTLLSHKKTLHFPY